MDLEIEGKKKKRKKSSEIIKIQNERKKSKNERS